MGSKRIFGKSKTTEINEHSADENLKSIGKPEVGSQNRQFIELYLVNIVNEVDAEFKAITRKYDNHMKPQPNIFLPKAIICKK